MCINLTIGVARVPVNREHIISIVIRRCVECPLAELGIVVTLVNRKNRVKTQATKHSMYIIMSVIISDAENGILSNVETKSNSSNGSTLVI